MTNLNLGCGTRYHPSWENVDLVPAQASIRRHDLRRRLPYPNGAFAAVYHSHVLEHFHPQEAPGFLRECFRVLEPGGIVRVAVPDLEQIARVYLVALERADAGEAGWDVNYDWMLLELFDQCVREEPGGQMLAFLLQTSPLQAQLAYERLGDEARRALDRPRISIAPQPASMSKVLSKLWRRLRDQAHKLLFSRADFAALQVGRFRQAGEIHKWMYDSYSLKRLLRRAGFQEPIRRAASESGIARWASFELDADSTGVAHKPDSLYMEALKPVAGRGSGGQ